MTDINDDIVYRLRKRAEIRSQITGRKSVQEGKPDRICELLNEAADEIEELRKSKKNFIASFARFFTSRADKIGGENQNELKS